MQREQFFIKDIKSRQILDSRGNPTIETDVILESGALGRAAVPSGASTGAGEALELRDHDMSRFQGQGVMKAVWNVNEKIRDILVGNSAANQDLLDQIMIELDGSDNKSKLGANAILSVSLAAAKAVSQTKKLPFYQYIAEIAHNSDLSLPLPMVNVMNGGAHADWCTDCQEYMIIPVSAHSINEAIRMSAEVFHSLKNILRAKGYATTVGDEGGYAPRLQAGNAEPLELISAAITAAGYKLERDFCFALDFAASELASTGGYTLKTNQEKLSSTDLIDRLTKLCQHFPIISLEDALGENDWTSWQQLTEKLGSRIQLVGDDIFVTNAKLLEKAISQKVANAILIKPNQIGSLSETIETVKLAKAHGYKVIISHRSGETEDTSIAHLAVGLGAGQIKTGSMSRSERLAKYNELIRIAEANPKLKLASPFNHVS